jgi:hypothetical protein
MTNEVTFKFSISEGEDTIYEIAVSVSREFLQEPTKIDAIEAAVNLLMKRVAADIKSAVI